MWNEQNSPVLRWVVVGIGLLCVLLATGCGSDCCPKDSLYEMERQYQLERRQRVDPHGHLQDKWGEWLF